MSNSKENQEVGEICGCLACKIDKHFGAFFGLRATKENKNRKAAEFLNPRIHANDTGKYQIRDQVKASPKKSGNERLKGEKKTGLGCGVGRTARDLE